MRLRVGFLVSKGSYDKILGQISPKNVFIPKSVKQEEYERLWFTLGSNILVLCIDKAGFDYTRFIESKNVVDLRSEDFSDFVVEEARTYLYKKIFDRYEIIKVCNELRNLIATSFDAFEWCGSEKESLVNEEIIRRAARISGISDNGYYYTGFSTSNDIIRMKNDYVMKLYNELEEKGFDDGQKKLFSNFVGFATNNDIVYVGCCPGDGWNEAARLLNWKGNVYCFDMKDAKHAYCRSHHKTLKITCWEDLAKNIPSGKFDFIWDVRSDDKGDFSECLDRISDEITLVNDILGNMNFRRCLIKINMRLSYLYLYRRDVRFFIQPFTLGRIRELRAVFNNTGEAIRFNQNLPDELAMFYDGCCYEDGDLFSNAFAMRYDKSDYCLNTFEEDTHKIVLFSANCNSKEKILQMTRMKSTISYFSNPDDFHEEEYSFPIMNFIDAGFRCFDSRYFGVPRIEGLYFVSNVISSDVFDESIMSESNVIKTVMELIIQSERHSDYQKLKFIKSRAKGYVFPKFPEPFSLVDKLVSPSGHMCRVAIGHKMGMCNLAQFLFKVLRNLREESSCSDRYMELTPMTLWHSKDEWILGLEVAEEWLGSDVSVELSDLIDYSKRAILRIPNDKMGSEIFLLKRKRGTINANFNCEKFKLKNKLLPGEDIKVVIKEVFKDEIRLIKKDLKKFVDWISNYRNDDKWKYFVNNRLDAHLRYLFFHYELDCLRHSKVWSLSDVTGIVLDGIENGWLLSNVEFDRWLYDNFNVDSAFPVWDDVFFGFPKNKLFKVLSDRFPLLYVNISELRRDFVFRKIV